MTSAQNNEYNYRRVMGSSLQMYAEQMHSCNFVCSVTMGDDIGQRTVHFIAHAAHVREQCCHNVTNYAVPDQDHEALAQAG